MSLPARISFSQIGIFISIIFYLVVRGAFVLVNIGGPFWTQVGGYLSVAFPLAPVIILGFAACVISYAFTYLGLWMMDNDFYIIGEITIFLSVIIIPGALAAYSWLGFTVV
ncbi:hypothetical protein E4H12_05015 [Candidatus Thorarchaeota archaeon]|nr:hypothetical protein [Candidatus Thorarchaeota archaeon]TFG98802.1 MAG: hypothetical protein E4H12_05015 [Candidatus Thorarchaeota archaeon]